MADTSTVKNVTVDTGSNDKYAVHAYATTDAVIENVAVKDRSEGFAGILVNVSTATVSGVVADPVVKVDPNASGLVDPDSELSFDKNGNLVVIEPETLAEQSALAYVGHKDKNCDSVITCEEEKCEGWIWNNELEVWECVIDS